MMNQIMLQGRLVKDPVISNVKKTDGEQTKATYRLAVGRDVKVGGNAQVDYINCIAFGNKANFAAQYLQKGIMVVVVGRLQTGSYEKDGKKIYTSDVWVEHQYPCNWNISPEKNLTHAENAIPVIDSTYQESEYSDYRGYDGYC